MNYKCFKFVRSLYDRILDGIELYSSAKISLEQSSWEHKSLALYHAQVCHMKKLSPKMAILLANTMENVKIFRRNANFYLEKGEEEFDEISNQLVKTTEVIIATKRSEIKSKWRNFG